MIKLVHTRFANKCLRDKLIKRRILAVVFIACRFRMQLHKKFVFEYGWTLYAELSKFEEIARHKRERNK